VAGLPDNSSDLSDIGNPMRKALIITVLFLVSCTPAPLQPTLTQQPSPLPAPGCAVVTAAEALHLRAGPSEKSQVTRYLYHGDPVKVISSSSDFTWWNITTSNGLEGWANAKYLQTTTCQQEE